MADQTLLTKTPHEHPTFMIYKLARTTSIGYDEYDSKIVRASSEDTAREIANQNTGDEGMVWTDRKRVKCEKVEPDGPGVELLGSFNAG